MIDQVFISLGVACITGLFVYLAARRTSSPSFQANIVKRLADVEKHVDDCENALEECRKHRGENRKLIEELQRALQRVGIEL